MKISNNYFKMALPIISLFLSMFFSNILMASAQVIDISTTNTYGLATILKQFNPKLKNIYLQPLKPLTTNHSLVHVLSTEGNHNNRTYSFFILDVSSNTIIKTITIFASNVEGVQLEKFGKNFITIAQHYMHTLKSRNIYFFDMNPASPVDKYPILPVNITTLKEFKENIFLSGTIGEEGAIIKLGLKDGAIDLKNYEIIKRIGNEKISSKIVLTKVENDTLKMYAHDMISIFDGKNWIQKYTMDDKYFRSRPQHCDMSKKYLNNCVRRNSKKNNISPLQEVWQTFIDKIKPKTPNTLHQKFEAKSSVKVEMGQKKHIPSGTYLSEPKEKIKKYVYTGRNLASFNKSNQAEFYEQTPYCDDRFFLYRKLAGKCELKRYTHGDDWMVRYSYCSDGKNSDILYFFPHHNSSLFKRYKMPSHIINISTSPFHSFFVWNNDKGTNSNSKKHGIYERADNECKFHPLPSIPLTAIRKTQTRSNSSSTNNTMGPFQKRDDNIWFCSSSHYNHEQSGLSSISYFNLSEKKYHIIHSTQIADSNCSALLAEKEQIFTGMNGLTVLDIKNNTIKTYKVPSTINIIKRLGNSIVMGTQNGIYILTEGKKILFLGPEISEDGTYQLLTQ
jgi:hypothetical protein